MATFKNITDDPYEIPLLGLRVPAGETFEVPEEFEGQFNANPSFAASRAKTPDVVPDPVLVESLTGPVPVVAPSPVD